MAISGRTESAMLRSMYAVKLVDRKNNEELMKTLALEEILHKLAKINGVLWHGQVVRSDDDNVLKALMLEGHGQRNRGRPKQIWRSKLNRI